MIEFEKLPEHQIKLEFCQEMMIIIWQMKNNFEKQHEYLHAISKW